MRWLHPSPPRFLNANYSFKYFGKKQGVAAYIFRDERDLLWYSTAGLAQQRYAKSHRILANCRGVKDFRRFRNSDQGRFMLSPTGACAWPVPAECRVDKGGKEVGFSNYNSPTSRKARLTGEQVLSVPLLHPEARNARIILRRPPTLPTI